MALETQTAVNGDICYIISCDCCRDSSYAVIYSSKLSRPSQESLYFMASLQGWQMMVDFDNSKGGLEIICPQCKKQQQQKWQMVRRIKSWLKLILDPEFRVNSSR